MSRRLVPAARALLLATFGGLLVSAAPQGPPTPSDSPLTMQDVMTSPLYRDLSTAKLAVGDPAFPFTLPLLDPTGTRPTGKSVSLESFRGKKPVALVFGSYT
jgi:hypothetical protein